MMDYIKQILAFDDYLMYNQGLSSGQIALWRALMSINNKTRWSEWFTASNQTLETLAGLSRQGINKNRNVLKQLGLIDFQTNGRKATSYHICKLYTSDSVQDSLQSSSATVAEKCTTQLRNSSTLYKHKQNININKNINDHIEDLGVYEFIQQAWKKAPTGLLQGALGPWIKEWGPELVLYAFKLAYENSVEMQGLKKYVQAILNNWAKRDIKTLEDAEKAQEMFEEQKKAGRSGYQKKPVREEKLPNWEGMQEDVPLSDKEQAKLERQMQELLGG